MKKLVLILFILILNCSYGFGQQGKNTIAHAHNDYEQSTPLHTALNLGYESIEIDILLHNGQLVVTHNAFNLSSKPTIDKLYFQPLRDIPNTTHSIRWILVDFKKYSKATLNQLHDLVLQYANLFQSRIDPENGESIKIILSGNIPRAEITNQSKYEYFFLDGRIEDLDLGHSLKYTPLISSNITAFTSWYRNHCLKEKELKEVSDLLSRIHEQGIKFRFWNTEDNTIIWDQLLDLGVDVISVDDLDKFHKFQKAIE